MKTDTRTLARTIVNPTEGYSVTFLVSGSETDYAYTYVEAVLPPGAGTPVHYHLDFTEEFEAVEGELGIQLGKKHILLHPGEPSAIVPLKVVHKFYNPGSSPVRFRAIIRPARRFEQLLRTTYGLAADGLCNKKGLPKSLLTLALVYEMGESYLPGLPLWFQKSVFGLLARIARYKKRDIELRKYYVGMIEASDQEMHKRKLSTSL